VRVGNNPFANAQINIAFRPDCKRRCTEIRFLQVGCASATLNNGSVVQVHPSYWGASPNVGQARQPHRTAGTAGKFCWVDALDSARTPYVGQAGRHKGESTDRDATYTDRPSIGKAGGNPPRDDSRTARDESVRDIWEALDSHPNVGNNSKDESGNPRPAVTRITITFTTCVLCLRGAGQDTGTVYGCQNWTFVVDRPAPTAGNTDMGLGTITVNATKKEYPANWRAAANAARGAQRQNWGPPYRDPDPRNDNDTVTPYEYPAGPDVTNGAFDPPGQ
jgi:hypothetical protein